MSRTIEVDFLPQAFEEAEDYSKCCLFSPEAGIRDQLK